MSEFRDYYHILGVSRNATQEDIRQAYRKLVFDLHPDRNPTPGAHARFLLVGEAYQTLSDPVKRGAYSLRYDRLKGLKKPPSATSGVSLEMARRKRASRYNRSGYAQRVRYRGSASGGGQPYDFGGNPRGQYERNAARSYSEAHAERIIEEERSARIGYQYYANMLRGIAGALLLFCLGMVLDRALATRSAPETVRSRAEAATWSLTAPGVKRITTELSSFSLKTHYAELLQPGDRILLAKSPLAKVVTRAYLPRDGQLLPLPVFRTRYTGPFPSVWLVILFCLATLLFRRNVEFSAYLGTFTMIVALIVLGVVLS